MKSKSGFSGSMIRAFLYCTDTKSSMFGKRSSCGNPPYPRHFVSWVMANNQGEFFVELDRRYPSCTYVHNFSGCFSGSKGEHWPYLSEYQWSNDSYEGFSVQSYRPYSGNMNISSPPQFMYLPSQFSLESP